MSSYGAIFIFIFCSFVCVKSTFYFDEDGYPIVKLSTGSIRGTSVVTKRGTKAFVFYGVPYGEPATGNLRFAGSTLRKPWSGVQDGRQYGTMCWANSTGHGQLPKYPSEDCLTANIFVPQDALLHGNISYPVLLYVHGGAWQYSNPSRFDSDMMVDNFVSVGLVYVTIGYRLGALGFWSTGTDDAPGNYALLDIILSLKWLKAEITYFGGTASRVTVMGESSGAQAVDILSVSPLSQGLFHQGVCLSGEDLRRDGTSESLDVYQQLAEMVGCSVGDDWQKKRFKKITSCMREIEPSLLTRIYAQDILHGGGSVPKVDGKNGVIPDYLDKLAHKRQKLNYLLGTTSSENSPINYLDIRDDQKEQDVVDACREISDEMMHTKYQRENLYTACLQQYVEKYPKPEQGTPEYSPFWAEQLNVLRSDFSSYVPTYINAASMRDIGSTVYLYSFDYTKQEPYFIADRWISPVQPFHAFDLGFLLGVRPFNFSENDVWIQKSYSLLFAQFARYGDPTYFPVNGTVWKPMVDSNYLSVDLTLRNEPLYHKEALDFWLGNNFIKTNFLRSAAVPKSDHSTLYVLGFVAAACIVVLGLIVYAVKKQRAGVQKKVQRLNPEMEPLMDAREADYYSFPAK